MECCQLLFRLVATNIALWLAVTQMVGEMSIPYPFLYNCQSTFFSILFCIFAFAKSLKMRFGSYFLWRLLIELYGIEIMFRADREQRWCLLIELYGIEIEHLTIYIMKGLSFNRTIWNWNINEHFRVDLLDAFNRTIWNWNERKGTSLERGRETFNRTIWNWNWLSSIILCISLTLLIELYGIEMRKLHVNWTWVYHF